MDIVSIDPAKLTDLCNTIRRLKGLKPKEKAEALTLLLKQADVIRYADSEQLMCLKCASELRGCNISSLFRLGENGRVHIYHLCHKDYYDRREIESLPPVGQIHDRKPLFR